MGQKIFLSIRTTINQVLTNIPNMQKNFDNPKQQYEDCFFNEDLRYEKPYELFIVSKDGIRRKIDIRCMKKVSMAFDLV
jgi:hypothetical protein